MATSTPKKTTVLSVRLDPQIKDLLREAARVERRSLTNLLEVAVLEYCDRRGLAAATSLNKNKKST